MSSQTVTRVFAETGEFAASHAAEEWCARHGISVGFMQRRDPRGLLYGDYAISKWRNLTAEHRRSLDGRMTGDMRNGPVTVTIRQHFTNPIRDPEAELSDGVAA
jgi:hypothetical protein